MNTVDLIDEQDEMKSHTERFVLWPRAWQGFDEACLPIRTWTMVKFLGTNYSDIPAGSGVYTFLIQPSIASHPASSYLMYVGQAASLSERFMRYRTRERVWSAGSRPLIVRLLNKYVDYVWFCYTLVPKQDLDTVEAQLRDAYRPPYVKQYTGEVGPAMAAF